MNKVEEKENFHLNFWGFYLKHDCPPFAPQRFKVLLELLTSETQKVCFYFWKYSVRMSVMFHSNLYLVENSFVPEENVGEILWLTAFKNPLEFRGEQYRSLREIVESHLRSSTVNRVEDILAFISTVDDRMALQKRLRSTLMEEPWREIMTEMLPAKVENSWGIFLYRDCYGNRYICAALCTQLFLIAMQLPFRDVCGVSWSRGGQPVARAASMCSMQQAGEGRVSKQRSRWGIECRTWSDKPEQQIRQETKQNRGLGRVAFRGCRANSWHTCQQGWPLLYSA